MFRISNFKIHKTSQIFKIFFFRSPKDLTWYKKNKSSYCSSLNVIDTFNIFNYIFSFYKFYWQIQIIETEMNSLQEGLFINPTTSI